MVWFYFPISPTGVIGGLAALAIAVTLFVALRYRFRRVAAKRPPSTLYGSEGASPNKPENTAAQSTITPGFAADHPMHQKFYVSPRSVVRSALY